MTERSKNVDPIRAFIHISHINAFELEAKQCMRLALYADSLALNEDKLAPYGVREMAPISDGGTGSFAYYLFSGKILVESGKVT